MKIRGELLLGNFIGIYAIVAIGLALLLGYAGQVSMAQAAFFGIGAYTSGVLTTETGWDNPWYSVRIRGERSQIYEEERYHFARDIRDPRGADRA